MVMGLTNRQSAVRTKRELQLAPSSAYITKHICYFMPSIIWIAMFAFISTCSQIYYLNVSAVGFPHMVQQTWIHICQNCSTTNITSWRTSYFSFCLTLMVFPNWAVCVFWNLSPKASFAWPLARVCVHAVANPTNNANRTGEQYKIEFNVLGSVHRKNILIYIQQDATLHSLIQWMGSAQHNGDVTPQNYTAYFIWKLLYMFRVVFPPIIRSANNCNYSIWYLSHRYCYLPL
jgi:hypothetical protein